MRKRVLLLCVLLAGLLLLSACGGEKPVGGEVVPSGEEVEVGGEISSNDAGEETNVADAPLSIGRVVGGVYTNAYLGIAAALDEDWAFLTAEELQELPSLASEGLEGTEIGEIAKEIEIFTDMQAENVNDLATLNIVYQRLDMASRLAYAQMTEEEVVEETLAQKDMIIEAYTQGGITTESIEKKAVQFLGEEHWALYTVASVEGTPYYMLQLFSFDVGEWGVTMTMGSYVEDQTESLLELFYKI